MSNAKDQDIVYLWSLRDVYLFLGFMVSNINQDFVLGYKCPFTKA